MSKRAEGYGLGFSIQEEVDHVNAFNLLKDDLKRKFFYDKDKISYINQLEDTKKIKAENMLYFFSSPDEYLNKIAEKEIDNFNIKIVTDEVGYAYILAEEKDIINSSLEKLSSQIIKTAKAIMNIDVKEKWLNFLSEPLNIW